MLTQCEVVPYLLRRGLVSARSVVGGDVAVVDVSRRNRNFNVLRPRSRSFLLKGGIAPEAVATVAREAAVYRLLRSSARANGVGRYLPRCYAYDRDVGVLILESFPEARAFLEGHARRHRPSPGLAAELGDALASLHCLRSPRVYDVALEYALPSEPPWVLSLHRPRLEFVEELSRANVQLIRTLQSSSELCRCLDELRGSWRAEALVHGDLKWDNVLLVPPSKSRKARLKIVDWELAGWGDPGWDLGSAFGAFLSSWALSIPYAGETLPERSLGLAHFPLETTQPAIRSLWRSYARRMGLDRDEADRRLVGAVRYAGARLVQAAFEQMQAASRLAATAARLLQLASNAMQRPREAAVHLLGIPFGE